MSTHFSINADIKELRIVHADGDSQMVARRYLFADGGDVWIWYRSMQELRDRDALAIQEDSVLGGNGRKG